ALFVGSGVPVDVAGDLGGGDRHAFDRQAVGSGDATANDVGLLGDEVAWARDERQDEGRGEREQTAKGHGSFPVEGSRASRITGAAARRHCRLAILPTLSY